MSTFTPETEPAASDVQINRSKISSVLVAGIIHAALLGAFIIWTVSKALESEPELIMRTSTSSANPNPIKPQTLSTMTAKDIPSASGAAMSRMITAKGAAATVQIPEAPTLDVDTVGLGDGFGDGFGAGMGGVAMGFGGGGMPQGSPIRDRCSKQDRKRRLLEGGGDDSTEKAVLNALAWFKSQQRDDGSWGNGYPAAMTGLVLLAYLGHCETFDSVEYGETVHKAIVYLADKALNDKGRILTKDDRHWPYEHGIATYALCEAYTMHKYSAKKLPYAEQLKEAIFLAVPIVIKGQNHDGGWIYSYEGSEYYKTLGDMEDSPEQAGDLSVAGWQMQALKAATLTELEFTGIKKAIERGVDFAESYQGKDGGFGYRGKGDKFSLTGVGVLSQQMFGKFGSSVSKGVRFILKQTFAWGESSASLYGWYYATQACFQRGNQHPDWKKWNGMFRNAVVDNQSDDGSWASEGGSGVDNSTAAGSDATIYRTALLTLMLEVYYRYLPATEK